MSTQLLKASKDGALKGHAAYRTVKYELKVIFSCLTAIPFLVFAFVYIRIGSFTTALSGFLVALALILVLEGFIIFKRMVDHIEQLSSTMTQALNGKTERIQDAGDTKELAMIADTFNRTRFKLEDTAKELGVRAVQAATLNEIRKIVSTSINMGEIAKVILERTVKAAKAQAGYLAVKQNDSLTLHVAAAFGITEKIPDEIRLDVSETLAGRVVHSNSAILIKDIAEEAHLKGLNSPDIGVHCLLYLPIVAKGSSIGVLVLGRDKKQSHFKEEDIQFLQTLLQQVAYSVENARLYENLQQSNKELESVLKSQRKAQDQLLASARMAAFGELSVNIAHELNNPLTGILGYTDLILGSSMDNPQIKELLEKLRTQALRASKITGNLLDFVNIEPGSKAKTDLNELVKKALSFAETRMLEGGIDLDLRLADELFPVMADPAQMGQVFFSLVSNALNAMAGASKVSKGSDEKNFGEEERRNLLSIESGKRHAELYVSFKDTGPGISPEHLSKIFEPFYSSQNKVSQVGLGLWASNRIVEAHGGVIRVENMPDKGNTFIVILPAA